jgi:hypothetical protein
MNNIFNVEDNLKLRSRIQQLASNQSPNWGKMTVSQMVLHCQKPLDVACGKLTLKQSFLGVLFGKIAKRNFIEKTDLAKNMPTAPQFKIRHEPDFESERQILLLTVTRFGDAGPSIITNKKHPFFGALTDEEWGILHYKHLDHHLTQFAV